MADLTNISKEISKNKNLDKNLSSYISNMMSLYNRFSYIKLSMNYYTYCDVVSELEDEIASDINSKLMIVNGIIEKNIVNNSKENVEADINTIISLREELISLMEIVTAYVDRFAIFEHILNRIEYKFNEEFFDQDYYENRLGQDIMNYILADRDNVVINGKIAEVVGQLPMRLTKNKFFDLVRDSLTLYNGQDLSSLEDFKYMLETISGIYLPEGFDSKFTNLHEIYNKLSSADYKLIDKNGYDEAVNMLNFAVDFVTRTSDLYVQLTEVINDVLVILYAKDAAFMDAEEIADCSFIIKSVLDNKTDELMDLVTDKFISFEGKQEKIYSTISSNDYTIDEINNSYEKELENLALTEAFSNLKNIAKLSSGSHFVSLTDKKKDTECTERNIEEVFNDFYTKLSAVFKDNSQIYNRAVMAAVLSSLPVFFNNANEIMDYINTSLSQCSDKSEQKACLAVFKMIMED